jgi:hypothetical protein
LSSDFKDDSVQEALQKLLNITYREQFEAGDREKLLRCVCLCDATDTSIPNWARHALAAAFDEWWQAQNAPGDPRKRKFLDHFILGKRVGRHANIPQAESDRHRRQVIFEAVDIAHHYGITGEHAYLFAQQLLTEYSKFFHEAVNADPSTLKTTYFQERRKGSSSDSLVRAELAMLAISLLPSLPDRIR